MKIKDLKVSIVDESLSQEIHEIKTKEELIEIFSDAIHVSNIFELDGVVYEIKEIASDNLIDSQELSLSISVFVQNLGLSEEFD